MSRRIKSTPYKSHSFMDKDKGRSGNSRSLPNPTRSSNVESSRPETIVRSANVSITERDDHGETQLHHGAEPKRIENKRDRVSTSSNSSATSQPRGTIYMDPLPISPWKDRVPRKRNSAENNIVGYESRRPRLWHRHSWQSDRDKAMTAYKCGIDPKDLDSDSD